MKVKTLAYISLLTALTTVGAIISIPLPFSPVPLTLQLPFTLISGVVLGPKYGAFCQLLYLALGAAGLPVFAQHRGGFNMLWGPTSGFLWGFVLSAYVTGWIAQRTRPESSQSIFLCLVVGLLVIYCCGIAGLQLVVGYDLVQAVTYGIMPFIIADLGKLIVTTLILQRLNKLGWTQYRSK